MRKKILRWLDDLLLIAGLFILAKAGFMVYAPAGWVIVGLELIFCSVLVGRWRG